MAAIRDETLGKSILKYLNLRPKTDALDSVAPVPVIPVRNKEDGESLTKLDRVFM